MANKIRLPYFKLDEWKFAYPYDEGGGCIVYPIFMGHDRANWSYYTNAAKWAANALIENSNIVEHRIPIFFYVDHRCYMRVPDAVQIPYYSYLRERHEKMREDVPWLAQKLYIVTEETLNRFDRVVFMDVDLILARPPDAERYDIRNLFKCEHPERFMTHAIRQNRDQQMPYGGYQLGSYSEEIELTRKIVKEVFGIEVQAFRNMEGYFNAFSPNVLDKDYKNFVENHANILWNDETLNDIFTITTGKELEDSKKATKLGVACNAGSFHESIRKNEAVFTHIDAERITELDDRLMWRELCKITN